METLDMSNKELAAVIRGKLFRGHHPGYTVVSDDLLKKSKIGLHYKIIIRRRSDGTTFEGEYIFNNEFIPKNIFMREHGVIKYDRLIGYVNLKSLDKDESRSSGESQLPGN